VAPARGEGGAGGASRHARALLAKLDALPPMPPVARRLMELGDLASADIGEIAGLIEMDPALSAGVLSMCRAAHTGLGDRVRTIRHAVTMLGVECMRRLALSTLVCETLRDGAAELDARLSHRPDEAGFDREGCWVHSVAVACASGKIARDTGRVNPELAFTAGLLRGIGLFALELVAPRAMEQICRLAAWDGVDVSLAERRVLGLDHAEAGVRLARRWGLPAELTAVLGEGRSGEHAELVSVVVAARWLCRWANLGWSGDWGGPGDGETVLARAGLDPEGSERVLCAVIGELAGRLGELGLVPRGATTGEAGVALMMAREAARRARVRDAALRPRTPGPGNRASGAAGAGPARAPRAGRSPPVRCVTAS
jgi:HD-like signal output (HDOD) protein